MTPKPHAVPISGNWHLWPKCNYGCHFCFQTSPDAQPPLGLEDSKMVIQALARAGMRKLTFVGGEPTLCPYLIDLVRETATQGIVPSIVTNASLLTKDALAQYRAAGLVWLGVSIDSFDESIQRALGRGNGHHVAHATRILRTANELGLRTKLNSVVTRLNLDENMVAPIAALQEAGLERWKPMRVLPIRGENDEHYDRLAITSTEFKAFVQRHASLGPTREDHEDMLGSYIMIDPRGRFFDNVTGAYVYGRPILEAGVDEAFADVAWNSETFAQRGGLYNYGSVPAPSGTEG